MIKKIKVHITGTTSLIMHNGEGANPNDSRELPDFLKEKYGVKTFKDAIKPLSSKRGKSEKDHESLAELGFYSSLYLNEKNQIIYPSECLEKMIQTQAKETKLGKVVTRGLSVPSDALLDFPNKDKPLEELYHLHKYQKLVTVSQSKTLRTRAEFPTWSCTFDIEFNMNVISEKTIFEILALGEFFGSLERRPKHGRYKLTKATKRKG